MALTAGEVVVNLDLNARQWTSGLRSAQTDLMRFQGEAVKAASGIQRVFQVAAGIGTFEVLRRGIGQLKQFAEEAVMAAGRVEEMDAVLQILGRNSGTTRSAIDEQIGSIKELGIETKVAQETLADFMRYNLKAADAAKLARVAQDVAVLGASNSSQTLNRLMWGIITRQPEVIRTSGLTVNFEQEFARMAAASKTAVGSLTEQQKIQAALNAVIKEGTSVEGAYEASMTSATKQVRSRVRYVEELKEAVGQMYLPIWSEWQFAINQMIKNTAKVFDPSGPVAGPIIRFSTVVAGRMREIREAMQLKFDVFKATGGLDKIGEWIQVGISKLNEFKGVFAGLGTAFAASGLSKLMGLFAGFALPPGLQVAASLFSALVASSSEFRQALVALGRAAATSFAVIVGAFEPVMAALQEAVTSAAPAIASLVRSIAELVPQVAVVVAEIVKAMSVLITLGGAVLTPIISAIATFVSWLTKSKVAIALITAALAVWATTKVVSWVDGVISGLSAMVQWLGKAATAWTTMGQAQAGATGATMAAGAGGAAAMWAGAGAEASAMQAVTEGAAGTIVGNTLGSGGSLLPGAGAAAKSLGDAGTKVAEGFARSAQIGEAGEKFSKSYMAGLTDSFVREGILTGPQVSQMGALSGLMGTPDRVNGMSWQQFIGQNPAGFSVDPFTGKSPTSGFMAAYPGMELKLPTKDLGGADAQAQFQRWLSSVGPFASMPGHYIGSWEHEGQTYFDLSRQFADERKAAQFGAMGRQMALWDVAAGEERMLTPEYLKGLGVETQPLVPMATGRSLPPPPDARPSRMARMSSAYSGLGLGTGILPLDAAIAVGVAELAIAWKSVSDAQDRAKEGAEAYGDTVLTQFGGEANITLKDRVKALDLLRARADDAARAYKGYLDSQSVPLDLSTTQGQWLGQALQMTQGGSAIGSAQEALAFIGIGSGAGGAGEEMQRTAAEAEAFREYWENFWEETVTVFSEGAAAAAAEVTDMLSQIKDSQKQFEAEFGINLGLDDMLPSQAKVITDMLDQLREATKSWSSESANFANDLSGAWSRAQEVASQKQAQGSEVVLPQLDAATLQGQAASSLSQVQRFRSDIARLTELGAAGGLDVGTMVLDLMKQGPQKIGDALASFTDQLIAMGDEEAQRLVSGLVDTYAQAAQQVEGLMMDLAMKLSEGELQINSPEAAAQFAQDYVDIGKQLDEAKSGVTEILPVLANRPAFNDLPGGHEVPGMAPGSLANLLEESKGYVEAATTGGLTPEQIQGQGQALQTRIRQAAAVADLEDKDRDLIQALQDELSVVQELAASYQDLQGQYESAAARAGLKLRGTPEMIAENEAQQGIAGKIESLATERGTSEGTFAVEDAQQLTEWFRQLGPVGVDALRKIEAEGFTLASVLEQVALVMAILKGEKADLMRPIEPTVVPESPFASEINKLGVEIDNARKNAEQARQPMKSAAEEAAEAARKAREEWENLKGAISQAAQAATDPVLKGAGLVQEAASGAETMGRALMGLDDPAESLANVQSLGANAVNSITDYVLALAEAGQIGRDQASITARMNEEMGRFVANLQAETDQWMKDNAAREAATKVAEELAKAWGKLKGALEATNEQLDTQYALQKAILSVGASRMPGQVERAAVQRQIEQATLGALEAIEKEAYALAQAGKIGSSTADIFNYIVSRADAMADSIDDTSTAVLGLTDKLGLFSQAWDSVLGPLMGAESAAMGVRTALDSLSSTYIDQIGIAMSASTPERDQQRAWDNIAQAAMGYIEAVKAEALAMANAGKIGSDYASIQKYIVERLQVLMQQFPELGAMISNYIAEIQKIPAKAETDAKFAMDAALGVINQYKATLQSIPAETWTTAQVNDYWARLAVFALLTDVYAKIPEYKNTTITADTSQATAAVDGLMAKFDQLAAKQLAYRELDAAWKESYRTYADYLRGIGSYEAANQAFGRYQQALGMLNLPMISDPTAAAATDMSLPGLGGGQAISIAPVAAGGVFGKNEVPQVAAGGSYILWAESSTQGEAYIPFATAVRKRAEGLLAQVAERFGGAYLPGVKAMAQGGITGVPITDSAGLNTPPGESLGPFEYAAELAKGLNALGKHPLLTDYSNLTLPEFTTAYNNILPLGIPPWLAEELRYHSLQRLTEGEGPQVIPSTISWMMANWDRYKSEWFMQSGNQVMSKHVVADYYIGPRDTPEHKIAKWMHDNPQWVWPPNLDTTEEKVKFIDIQTDPVKKAAFDQMVSFIGGDEKKAQDFAAFARAQQAAFDQMVSWLKANPDKAQDWANFVQNQVSSVRFAEQGGPLFHNVPLGMTEAEALRLLANADRRAKVAVPMIAQPGANILWAEGSTHGEAYIPFAPGVRARAEGLLEQVARQFGGQYLPAGTPDSVRYAAIAQGTTMAAGGMLYGRPRFGSNPVVGTSDLVSMSDGPPRARAESGIDLTSLVDAVEMSGEKVSIENLTVQTVSPPREWLDELSWRRMIDDEVW